MCDAITGLLGFGGGTAAKAVGLVPAGKAVAAPVDTAAAERANAEAAAAQSAQARLAMDQRRRRAGAGLLSSGATDAPLASTGTATIQPVTNGTAGKQQSLLARGSPASFFG